MEPKDYCSIITGQNECFLLLLLLMSVCCCCCCCFQTIGYLEGKLPVSNCRFLICQLIGRAKRAPHWGVQSRFRVIYIYIYVVGMSRMSN